MRLLCRHSDDDILGEKKGRVLNNTAPFFISIDLSF